ncbi:MAG: aldehyde dehydrogenase family protein [Planctomycetota bacterium]|jgi:acyl-CoA reductase-like NAD-dependent aldehyde dehydrogenase
MSRLSVVKTCKLYINGAFVRSESGRTFAAEDADGELLAHVSQGSRKDMRDAVDAAHAAQGSWSSRSAYNRGQILYRMAEMMEGRRAEFVDAIRSTTGYTLGEARREVDTSVDRLVCFAGWADKIAHVLGGANPVVGPYYNFTVPEATGVVALLAPDEPPLLALVSMLAPPLCAGNAIVAIASAVHPLPAVLLSEVCATSDVPSGAVNIITAHRAELLEHVAGHREVEAIAAANLDEDQRVKLQQLAADNITRVNARTLDEDDWYDADATESPWTIEPFVEMKTIWHPSAT